MYYIKFILTYSCNNPTTAMQTSGIICEIICFEMLNKYYKLYVVRNPANFNFDFYCNSWSHICILFDYFWTNESNYIFKIF